MSRLSAKKLVQIKCTNEQDPLRTQKPEFIRQLVSFSPVVFARKTGEDSEVIGLNSVLLCCHAQALTAVKVFTHTNKELVKLAASQRTPNRQGSKHKHISTLAVTQCRYQKTCKCDLVWKL